MRIYTGGTFDGFHLGHVRLLQRCRGLAGPGGTVIVSLNTDDFVRRYKGRPPVMPYEEREAILVACRYVDGVIPNSGNEDSRPAILAAIPDVIVVGDDWAPPRDYAAQMGFDDDWLAAHRIRVMFLPRTPDVSSSARR